MGMGVVNTEPQSEAETFAEQKQKLFLICKKFIQDNKVRCAESSIKDQVYENAPELVEAIGNVIGFYKEPETETKATAEAEEGYF